MLVLIAVVAVVLIWLLLGALVLARSLSEQSDEPVPGWANRWGHLAKGRLFRTVLFLAIGPAVFCVVWMAFATAIGTFVAFFGETRGIIFGWINLLSVLPACGALWRLWKSLSDAFA